MPELYPQFFSSSTVTNIKKDAGPEPVNQDALGCFTIKKTGAVDQSRFLHDLFGKIDKKLFAARLEGKDMAKSGSTFCAVLYDPMTQIFSTANLGDSRAYCCLQETTGEKRKFLISLTRDDDPNNPLVAAEYIKRGGTIIVDPRVKDDPRPKKYVTSPGSTGILAMTSSFGDHEIEKHIRTPLILNFTIDEIAASIRDVCEGEVTLTDFFVASDGFCDVEKFFTQEINSQAPFCQINLLNINEEITDRSRATPAKSFQKIARDSLDYSKVAEFFKKYTETYREETLAHHLTNLSRAVGSKDDISIGNVKLTKFYEMLNGQNQSATPPTDPEMLLSFVCDGHGRNGYEVVSIIKQAVEEFVIEQNNLYSSQHLIEDQGISENDNLFTNAMLQEAAAWEDKEISLEGKVDKQTLQEGLQELEENFSEPSSPQGAARAASIQSLNSANSHNL